MDDSTLDQSLTEQEAGRLGRVTVGCVGVVVGVLILLLLISHIFGARHAAIVSTFAAIERWATFIANLLVVLYCFPTYRVTGQRPFLWLAFAALSFAYGSLFSLLFGIRPSAAAMHSSHSQIVFYYGSRYVAHVVGLSLYAWGIVSLARSTRVSRQRKV